METPNQAIELVPALKGHKKAIYHKTVISLGHSEFQCLDCGRIWKESITSPQILQENNVNEYYREYTECTEYYNDREDENEEEKILSLEQACILAEKKIERMLTSEESEIRQHGKSIFSGDGLGIAIVFNNITGKNFEKDPEGYRNYLTFIESLSVDLNAPIELYEKGKFIKTGKIRLFTNEK